MGVWDIHLEGTVRFHGTGGSHAVEISRTSQPLLSPMIINNKQTKKGSISYEHSKKNSN